MKLYTKQQHIQNHIVSAERKSIIGFCGEHGHDFFEIEYILSGTGNYIIDGTVYPMQSNTLFFMSPANFHAVENADAEIINIMFPCDLCDPAILFHLISHNAKMICFSEEDSILATKMLSEIVQALIRGDTAYAVQFLRSFLYKLTVLTPQPQKTLGSHIQSTIIYILEKFRTNMTLQSAAEHVGLVPAYLSVLFYQETGIHFKTYVDNLRFDYATNLLTSTDMNISEICIQSGFSDYANFTRRFKDKYHLTPKTYRMKQHITSDSPDTSFQKTFF